jgi:pilus assembly protein CpaC
MHRITRLPRSIVLTTLFSLAAFLGLASPRAVAQDKAAIVAVPIGGSQTLEMSQKQRIKDIDNKDQNVARVDFYTGSDYRKVMIIGGGGAGITHLVLTDADGNKEAFDIIVEQNLEFLRRVLKQAAPTANIEIIQGTGNSLVLTGTVAQASDIDIIMRATAGTVGKDNIVNAMRIGGVQQVQLDVVIARVARSETRNMGFSFFENGIQHFVGSTIGGGNTFAGALANSIGTAASSLSAPPPEIAFGIFNNQQSFLGFLEALRTENLVKLMAQPKVCTLSGRPANFVSGGEQAVPTLASGSAGGGAVSGVDFKPFGTTVSCLPLVLGGGKIYLEVEPEFTFPDPDPLFSAPVNGGQVFGRTTQRVKTSAILEDGQTMAIGGMIFHNVNGTATKLPVLGDLPFIGAAFRRMTYTNADEELLILITPHLIDALACDQVPRCLPGQETRKPDDYELFLEGILEAPRGPRQVCQDGRYVPAFRNGPTGNMYPTPDCNGPRGACDLGFCPGPSCLPEHTFNFGAHGCSTCQGVMVETSKSQQAPVAVPGPVTGVQGSGQPAPVAPKALAEPKAPAAPTQGNGQPQLLPESRTQFQRTPDSVTFETAPMAAAIPPTAGGHEEMPGVVQQASTFSGVRLAAPTPLEDRR